MDEIKLRTVCIVIAPPGVAFFDHSGAYIGQCGVVTEIHPDPAFIGGTAYVVDFSDGVTAHYARACLRPIAPPAPAKTLTRHSALRRVVARWSKRLAPCNDLRWWSDIPSALGTVVGNVLGASILLGYHIGRLIT